MKTVYKITSWICALIAVISVFFAARILFGRTWGLNWFFFHHVVRSGFMSVMGSVIGIIFTVVGFAVMGYCGIKGDILSRRTGLIAGVVITGVSLLSLIGAVIGHSFSGGDLIMLAVPALYTVSLIKTA